MRKPTLGGHVGRFLSLVVMALASTSKIEAVGQVTNDVRQSQSVRTQNLVNPPLIKADVAARIAEVLLQDRWGEGRAKRQLPLRVEDKGDRWRVLGGAVSASTEVGDGQFCLLLRKADGLIIEIGIFHGPGGAPD